MTNSKMQIGPRALLVLTLAFFVASCHREQKALSEADAATSFVPARRGELVDKVSVAGVVRSERRTELRADRDLQVASVAVQDYQKVKKGTLLIAVDVTETKKKRLEIVDRKKTSELQQKSSSLKFRNLERNLERKHQLFLKGIVAATDYEKAAEEFENAKTDLKTKELDAQKTARELAEIDAQQQAANILAPLDGVASEVVSLQGSNKVSSGNVLAVVSDPSHLALWIRLNEVFLVRVKSGMTAKVRLDAFPGKFFGGRITQISTTPLAAPANGPFKEFDVAIGFPSGDDEIREGFQGNAEIEFGSRDKALVVPLAAIKVQDGKSYVVVADALGGGSDPRSVETGLKSDTEIEVVKGLADGDRVLIK